MKRRNPSSPKEETLSQTQTKTETDAQKDSQTDSQAKGDDRMPDLWAAVQQLGHKSSVAECYHFKYIEYGYRQTKTVFETFLTLFTLHNETMNIWSHLIGFLCVIFAGVNISIDVFSSANTSSLEAFAIETYIVCAAICLLFSTIYHLFGCISEYCHDCLLKLDLSGVALLVSGSFLPAVYYGFYCTPDIQRLYLGFTIGTLVVGLSAPWITWTVCGYEVKPFVLASLVVFGALPFAHWLLITPTQYTDDLIWGYILMFFWYTVGFLTWFLRVPEVFFPNSTIATYILPSHTIWHICVLFAVYVWFGFVLTYREKLQELGCAAYADCSGPGQHCDNML